MYLVEYAMQCNGVQVRVVGAQYGQWGRSRYGMKPTKVDALEFYPERLEQLWKEIQEEQVHTDNQLLHWCWQDTNVAIQNAGACCACMV